MNSPLFPCLDETASYSFKTIVSENAPESYSLFNIAKYYSDLYQGKPVEPPKLLKYETVTVNRASGTPMSIKQAEDTIFNAILTKPNDSTTKRLIDVDKDWKYVRTPRPCFGDANPPLSIMINRGANLIAARTKIACGNIVLLHPNNLAIMKEEGVGISWHDTQPTMGRWKNVGIVNKTVQIWVCKDFPHDEMLVVLNDMNASPGVMIGENFVTHPEFEEFTYRVKLEFNLVHEEESLVSPVASEFLGTNDVSILDASYTPLEIYGSDNEIIRLSSNLNRLRMAAKNLIDDVKRRHPGESLKCPLMQALEKALDE